MSEVTTEQLQELVEVAEHCLSKHGTLQPTQQEWSIIKQLAQAELSRRAAVPVDRQKLMNDLLAALPGLDERCASCKSDNEEKCRWCRLITIAHAAFAALSAPSQPVIELSGIAEALAEGDGFWHACSGCHELNEGHDTGPHSQVFKCTLGVGCGECGGLGAVWDTADYTKMYQYLSEDEPSQPSAADKPERS